MGIGSSQTAGCSTYGHPEFEIRTSGLPDFLLSFLVNYLEQSVASGSRFLPGQNIQMGARVLRVAPVHDRLTLLEQVPNAPEAWDPSVSRTMLAMYRQRCALESVGMLERLAYPAPGALATVCRRAEHATATVFTRYPTEERGDSGWAVLCTDEDHDHDAEDELLVASVDTLCDRVPLFSLFLAMPAGILVVREGSKVLALDFDRAPLLIQRGSFLDRLRLEHGWPI